MRVSILREAQISHPLSIATGDRPRDLAIGDLTILWAWNRALGILTLNTPTALVPELALLMKPRHHVEAEDVCLALLER